MIAPLSIAGSQALASAALAVSLVVKIEPSRSNMSARITVYAVMGNGDHRLVTTPALARDLGVRSHGETWRMGGCGFSRSYELASWLARRMAEIGALGATAEALHGKMLVV